MTLPQPNAGPARARAFDPGPGSGSASDSGAAALPDVTPCQVRQGDVLLVPVHEVPDAARPVARTGGRLILAEGEATGHAHAIRSPGATLLRAGDERYLRLGSPASLDHEEHAPIAVEPGTYRIVIQREYVPAEIAASSSRQVVD